VQVTPFLMFAGNAEEAVRLYVSAFDDGRLESLDRWGHDSPVAGKVQRAVFSLAGQRFLASDSSVSHDFGFTPALSLFVEVETEAAVDAVVERLGEGGGSLMPVAAYPFSRRFGWITDRFGVSWQVACA
jgi:predicted 3-demethylubiquinone-9 3-methyltransferase (glyoxalase superfamily)